MGTVLTRQRIDLPHGSGLDTREIATGCGCQGLAESASRNAPLGRCRWTNRTNCPLAAKRSESLTDRDRIHLIDRDLRPPAPDLGTDWAATLKG